MQTTTRKRTKNIELELLLENEGYLFVKFILGKGYVGLRRMAFTVGLVYGLSLDGYKGRYCYQGHSDAMRALKKWEELSAQGKTIEGDPDDSEWIKHKGRKEYANPNKIQ